MRFVRFKRHRRLYVAADLQFDAARRTYGPKGRPLRDATCDETYVLVGSSVHGLEHPLSPKTHVFRLIDAAGVACDCYLYSYGRREAVFGTYFEFVR